MRRGKAPAASYAVRFQRALSDVSSRSTNTRRNGMKHLVDVLREVHSSVACASISKRLVRSCDGCMLDVMTKAFQTEVSHQQSLVLRKMEFFSSFRDALQIATENCVLFDSKTIRKLYRFLHKSVFSCDPDSSFLLEDNYHEQFVQVFRRLLENDRTLEFLPEKFLPIFVHRFVTVLLQRCCSQPANFSSLLLLLFQRYPRIGFAALVPKRRENSHRSIIAEFSRYWHDLNGKFSSAVHAQVLEAMNLFFEAVGVNYIPHVRTLAASARLFTRYWSPTCSAAFRQQLLRHMQLLCALRLEVYDVPFLDGDGPEIGTSFLTQCFQTVVESLKRGTSERPVSFSSEFDDVASDVLFFMQVLRRRSVRRDGTNPPSKKRRRIELPRDQLLSILEKYLAARRWVVVRNVLKVFFWCAGKWTSSEYRIFSSSRASSPRLVESCLSLLCVESDIPMSSVSTPSDLSCAGSLLSELSEFGGDSSQRIGRDNSNEVHLKNCQKLAFQVLMHLYRREFSQNLQAPWVKSKADVICRVLVESLGTESAASASDLLSLIIRRSLAPVDLHRVLDENGLFKVGPSTSMVKLVNVILLRMSDRVRSVGKGQLLKWILGGVRSEDCQIHDLVLLLRNALLEAPTEKFPDPAFRPMWERVNPYLPLHLVMTPFEEAVPDLVLSESSNAKPVLTPSSPVVDVEAVAVLSDWLGEGVESMTDLDFAPACRYCSFFVRLLSAISVFRGAFVESVPRKIEDLVHRSAGRVVENFRPSSQDLLTLLPMLRSFFLLDGIPTKFQEGLRDKLLSYLRELPDGGFRRLSYGFGDGDDDDGEGFMDEDTPEIAPEDIIPVRRSILAFLARLPGSLEIFDALVENRKSLKRPSWVTCDRILELLGFLSETTIAGLEKALELLPSLKRACTESRRAQYLTVLFNGLRLIQQDRGRRMALYHRLGELLVASSDAFVEGSRQVRRLLGRCLSLVMSFDGSDLMDDSDEDEADSWYSRLITVFSICCSDSDFFVRLEASQLFCSVLASMDDPQLCFSDMFEGDACLVFVATNASDLIPRTSLVCLAYLCASNLEILGRGLFLMLQVGGTNCLLSQIRCAIRYVSSRCGYSNSRALLREFLPSLFCRWIERDDCHLNDFAHSFFNLSAEGAVDGFFRREKSVLLPFVFENPKLLKEMSSLCEEDLQKLSDVDFANVYSYSLLSSCKSGSRISPLLNDRERILRLRHDIVKSMILSCCPFVSEEEEESEGEEDSRLTCESPFFSSDVLWLAVDRLAKDLNRGVLCVSDFAMMDVLMSLLLTAERSLAFKRQRFDVGAQLLCRFVRRICHRAPLFRSALHFLGAMLHVHPMLPDTLGLLKDLLHDRSEQDVNLDAELLPILQVVAKTLVETGLAPESRERRDAVCDLVRDFLALPAVHLRRFLLRQTRLLELLPGEKQAPSSMMPRRIDLLKEELTTLVKTPDPHRLQFVSSLLEDDHLRQELCSESLAPLLSSFNARLLHFATGPFSLPMRKAARHCLVSLGLDVLRILPQHSHVRDEIEFPTYAQLFKEEDSRPVAWSDVVGAILSDNIVPKIHTVLISEDIEIAAVAFGVLRDVFSTVPRFASRPPLRAYVAPFRESPPDIAERSNEGANSVTDELSLWEIPCHEDWARRVCHHLLSWVRTPALKLCAPLVRARCDVAELVFPVALFELVFRTEGQRKRLRSLCDTVFKKGAAAEPATIRLVLSAVLLVYKMQRVLLKKVNIASLRGNLAFFDPMMAARAAHETGVHFTALFFLQMGWRRQCERSVDGSFVSSDVMEYEEVVNDCPRLLRSIYRSLNQYDSDGLDGVNKFYGLRSRLLQFEHDHDWGSAVGTYELALSHESNLEYVVGHLEALKQLHHNHSLECVLRALPPNSLREPRLQEPIYECLWRLFPGFQMPLPASSLCGFHESVYHCLRAFAVSHKERFLGLLRSAFGRFLESDPTGVLDMVIRVQMLKDLERGFDLRVGTAKGSLMDVDSASSSSFSPIRLDRLCDLPLESYESLLLLRMQILHLLGRNEERIREICRLSARCRKDSRFDLARKYIEEVSLFSGRSCEDLPPTWLLEEAKIAWKGGKKEDAIRLLKFFQSLVEERIRQSGRSPIWEDLRGKAYYYLGRWEGANRSQVSDVIKRLFYSAKRDLVGNPDFYPKVLFHYARWYDSQLEAEKRRVFDESRREIFEDHVKARDRNAAFLKKEKRRQRSAEYRLVHQQMTRMNRIVEREQKARASDESQLAHSRKRSFRLHLETLKHSSSFDLYSAFRVCSLWFKNLDDLRLAKELMEHCVANSLIDPVKFLPLVYQIASRLGKGCELVRSFLVKICKAYPFHSLMSILALRNGQVFAPKENPSESDPRKIEEARSILVEVSKNSDLCAIVQQLSALVGGYLKIIFWSITKKEKAKGREIRIPRDCLLNNVTTNRIPVLTRELDPKLRGFPTIRRFGRTVSLCGGVNVPKVILCIDSEGTPMRQLLKGKDDLRQDSVMQQIFSLVDRLLNSTKDTRSRRLHVRTYKVVPMAPTSGILGWCENTIPLYEYLVGKRYDGAHIRYYPELEPPQTIRAKWKAFEEGSPSVDRKQAKFHQVTSSLQPALHHFFLERGDDPAACFFRQLAYTRSVASSSMIGFVVGLGDRHSNNILLDKESAEVIHIDLGVAFDQGKLLKLPEMVPFRLTADVVDGFGITGVEGVFRRSCVACLSVLRENSHLLTTVLEVFLFDPLYRWDLTPDKICEMQVDEDEVALPTGSSALNPALPPGDGQAAPVNRNAKRCLMAVVDKLRGLHQSEQLSVSGQVNRLIQQAQDGRNLCQMFSGWAAWL